MLIAEDTLCLILYNIVAASEVLHCNTGITMFKNMPRQMFGRVQAKLFPQYFATATAAVVLQLGTLAFGTSMGLPRPQLITLGEAL